MAVPQVNEILSAYNPEILWWDTPCNMSPESVAKFLSITVKYPKLITNNRLGADVGGDLETPEQEIPATGIPDKNWESCMTMNGTWGYSVNDHDWKSTSTLIQNLIDIASKGGNYLLNIGPTSEGLIPQPSIERLKEVGAWLKVNAEAVYGTTASPFTEISWGRVTRKKIGNITKLYLQVFEWPSDGKLVISGLDAKIKKIYPLAAPKTLLKSEMKAADLTIDVSQIDQTFAATVIVMEISGDLKVYERPEIKPESSVFIDKVAVDFTTKIKNGDVHFTTDDTEPTLHSQKASEKEILKGNSDLLVKALTYVEGKPVSGVAIHEIKRQEPLEAIFESKHGLRYKYYEGFWRMLPDFTKLTPVKTGVSENLALTEKNLSIYYAFAFDGYVQIPETNVYTFYLASNDGSKLVIDNQKVLDNDGLHYLVEKGFDVALSAGLHKIEVQYFQNAGNDGLILEWKPMGKPRSPIDESLFWH